MAENASSPAPPSTTTLHDVPDKLLRLILERLREASPLCAIYAAATCKRWRRIVTHHGFFPDLMNCSTCRPPHVVAGSYHNRRASISQSPLAGGLGPIFVPSSSPAAPAIDSRHFSLDFLPGGSGSWQLVDSMYSLLLLAKKKKTGRWMRRCFPDLLVCEPITRRYQLIPRMEEMKYHRCLGVFMYRCESIATWTPNTMDSYVVDSMSTFEVICVVYSGHPGLPDDVGGGVTACIFRRDKCRRRSRGPHSWYTRHRVHHLINGMESLRFLGRAAKYLFWSIDGDNERLLTLAGTVFGFHPLPDNFQGQVCLRVTDDNCYHHRKVRAVCLRGNDLRVMVASTYYYDGPEWVLHESLELMEATRGLAGYREEYFVGIASLRVVTANSGSVVLAPAAVGTTTWMFSVNLVTLEVAEYSCNSADDYARAPAYPCELPWPPTLRACVRHCTKNGRGRCSHTCTC